MNRQIPDHLYQTYKNMIRGFAWSYNRRTGIPFEELEAQGNLIFCEAYHTYNKNTSSFSTHLSVSLNGKLMNHTRKILEKKSNKELFENSYSLQCEYLKNWILFSGSKGKWPDKILAKIELDEMINKSSPNAHYIILLEFQYPKEMMNMHSRQDNSGYQYRISKSLVTRYLRKKGWTKEEIILSFREITKLLERFIRDYE